MKRIHAIFASAALAALLLTGCLYPTQSTIMEFDGDGKVVKKTVTSESVVKTVVESTKDKLVFLNDQSWLAGIRAVPPGSSTDNPMGTLEIVAGRKDVTAITMPMSPVRNAETGLAGLEGMIGAVRAGDIAVSATGISSGNAPEENRQ